MSRNCADFAKDIINFYYPKALHRSVFADLGMTTPKQIAKTITKYSARHPAIHFSRVVIAQVPGSMPRSTTAHGVVESFFKSKKYIVPSAVVSPIFAGCVAGVYFTTGAGHFEPARNARVFQPSGNPESPAAREDLVAYRTELKHYLAAEYADTSAERVVRNWERLQSHAKLAMDADGHPILQMQLHQKMVVVGAASGNILDGNAPPELARHLLEARLQSELRHPAPHGLSENELARDWDFLQKAISESDPHLASRASTPENTSGNGP